MSGVPSDVVVQSSSVLLDRVTVVALTVSPRCVPAQPWFQLGLEDEPTVRWPPTDRSWCGLAASAAVSSRGQPVVRLLRCAWPRRTEVDHQFLSEHAATRARLKRYRRQGTPALGRHCTGPARGVG